MSQETRLHLEVSSIRMIPRNVRYLLVILLGLTILACDNVTEQPDYRPEPSIDSPTPDLTREVTPSPAHSSTPQPLPTVRPSPTPSQPTPPPTPQPPPTPIAPGSGGVSQGSFTKPLNLSQLLELSMKADHEKKASRLATLPRDIWSGCMTFTLSAI